MTNSPASYLAREANAMATRMVSAKHGKVSTHDKMNRLDAVEQNRDARIYGTLPMGLRFPG